MDELFVFLLVGAIGLCLVGVPLLALVAFVRSGRTNARMRRLEERLGELERQPSAAPRAHEAPSTPSAPAVAPEPRPGPGPVPKPLSATPPPARPAPATPPPAKPAAPRPEPRKKIEWERWVGVRGFAVVGGIVLALAAILFFQHAFTKGWITPAMRVALGLAAGVACLVTGGVLRRRAVRFAPAALEGAGLVAFYAAIWAAAQRYSMISLVAAFPAMGVVTALGVFLANRHRSLLVAVLGLMGGFATPLLLSSGEDHPFGLFGYLLLLDLGLLFVGHRRRWPSLGMLAFLGTAFFEAAWVLERMGDERLWLGLAILSLFALTFAVLGRSGGDARERARWMLSQASAVMFPFVFAVYFARNVDLRGELLPLAGFVALLAAAAGWIGRSQRTPWLPVGAAVATVTVLGTWLAQVDLSEGNAAWTMAGVAAGWTLLFALFAELERARPLDDGQGRGATRAAAFVATGLLAVLAVSPVGHPQLDWWAPLTGAAAVAVLALRVSGVRGFGATALVAGLGLGAVVALHQVVHARTLAHAWTLHAAVVCGVGAALVAVAALRRDARRWTGHGAQLFLLAALVTTDFDWWDRDGAHLGAGLLLAGLAAVQLAGATVQRSTVWYALAAFFQGVYVLWWSLDFPEERLSSARAIAALLLTLALALAWPATVALAAPRLADRRGPWRAAAIASVLLAPPVYRFFEARFGKDLDGVPCLVLGTQLLLLAFVGTHRRWPASGGTARTSARNWLFGAALVYLGFAAPMQVETKWLGVGLAFAALALAFGATRLRSSGPAWAGAVFALAGATYLTGIGMDGYEWRAQERWLFSGLSWTYFGSAAALVLGATCATRCGASITVRSKRLPASGVYGLGALVLVFVGINLTVLDHFTSDGYLAFALERVPARDLTMSIAWVVYALVLLGLGVGKGSGALRWSSLVLLLITLAKVFLYDLGELEGLYRVGSLAGLAISLLLVSVLYQRFVFRRDGPAESDG